MAFPIAQGDGELGPEDAGLGCGCPYISHALTLCVTVTLWLGQA
jgi:hypothetical protein